MVDELTSGSSEMPTPGTPSTPEVSAAPGTPVAAGGASSAETHGQSQGQYGEQGGRGGRRGRHGDGGEQGGRGGRGHGRRDRQDSFEEDSGGFEEEVVKIYRCATVVKGGRRFSFAALVVVGDRNGQVGVGYGKANEVPAAVEKATKAARRNVVRIKMDGTSIPHRVMSKYRASKVLLLPAGEGIGVIAGASVRSVLELAGVKDVLTKCYGSTSPKNLVKAAFLGLAQLRSKDDVAGLRTVSLV